MNLQIPMIITNYNYFTILSHINHIAGKKEVI
jgi:hypothetical protein